MRNLHLTFDYSTYGQKYIEDFAKFCGLLRMFELYLENTERREVIRQTWGTVQKESDQESKLIFVTGQHYQTKQRSQKMKSLRSPKMDVAWTKNKVRRSVVILIFNQLTRT